MEREIRESTLDHVIPDLTKGQVSKANKKHGSKFAPKYRAFSILQNQIEDVVRKSTQMWKSINGLKTRKEGEEDPFEGRNDDEEVEEDEEKEAQEGDKATTEEQQQEQSVQDTQLPPPSPLHTQPILADTIIVKDVPDILGQNINPLTIEDFKKILHQTIVQ